MPLERVRAGLREPGMRPRDAYGTERRKNQGELLFGGKKKSLGRVEGGEEGSSSVGDQEGASSGAGLLELGRSSLKGSRGQGSFAPWSRHTDSRNHLENGRRSPQSKTE